MNYQITELPDGSYQFQSFAEFSFTNGGLINTLTLVYETYGKLAPTKNNVVLIHHALSTNSHLSAHKKNPNRGWWEAMVGPGKPIDTERFFVICINNLGSCFGSSGPMSINPVTQQPYQADFPLLTIEDMVNSQHLLLTKLGIEKLHAVIGNSMGAMLSLSFAVLYPTMVNKLISVSSGYKAYPVHIAVHNIQRDIIQLDPAWQNGYYTAQPMTGFTIARKIGLLNYRNPSEMNARFTDQHEIENYLNYNAEKFINRFDANTFLYLIRAMDMFDVSRYYQDPLQAFRQIQANTLVVSVDSDMLNPPIQQQQLYNYLCDAEAQAKFILHNSDYGHDSFYTDADIGKYIHEFIG